MKKIITVLLTLTLALSLCACDKGGTGGKTPSSSSDLTAAEIQQALAEMEAEEAAAQQ